MPPYAGKVMKKQAIASGGRLMKLACHCRNLQSEPLRTLTAVFLSLDLTEYD